VHGAGAGRPRRRGQRGEQIGDRYKLRLRGWLVAWGVGELPYGGSGRTAHPPAPRFARPRCSPDIAGGFGNLQGSISSTWRRSLARMSAPAGARKRRRRPAGDKGSASVESLLNDIGLGRQAHQHRDLVKSQAVPGAARPASMERNWCPQPGPRFSAAMKSASARSSARTWRRTLLPAPSLAAVGVGRDPERAR